MEKAGQKVFSLCVGEPDYQPPEEVLKATREAADNGITKYTGIDVCLYSYIYIIKYVYAYIYIFKKVRT
jgi:bifunctional pyridoxal-dependent enzyme with beta-cystathionase and maltose regulon repressor activities